MYLTHLMLSDRAYAKKKKTKDGSILTWCFSFLLRNMGTVYRKITRNGAVSAQSLVFPESTPGIWPKRFTWKNILDLSSKLFSNMVCLITFGTKVFVSLLLFSFLFIFFYLAICWRNICNTSEYEVSGGTSVLPRRFQPSLHTLRG